MNARLLVRIVAGLSCVFVTTLSAAQTIQLPSIQAFSYSGSVMVPDSGSAYLGGNSSYGTSASGRGGFRGSSGLDSSLSAHATIIDLHEMDREIRGLDLPNRFDTPQGRRIDPLDDAKSLVRTARKLRIDGNHSQSRAAYRLAIAKLDGLARLPRARSPLELARDPGRLAVLARSEFFSVYPDERLTAMGTP